MFGSGAGSSSRVLLISSRAASISGYSHPRARIEPGDADQGVVLASLRDLALVERIGYLLLTVLRREPKQPNEIQLVFLDIQHLAGPVVARDGEVARAIL